MDVVDDMDVEPLPFLQCRLVTLASLLHTGLFSAAADAA
jgi:hypothetical protein